MMNLEVYRGDTKIAAVEDEQLWVVDDQDGACRLIMALVQLGVPVDKTANDRYELWRVQIQDPDFLEALKGYLEEGAAVAFGLTVGPVEGTPEEG